MLKRKGFSLIEIIVVLIIIAILTAMALPNYMTNMEQGAAKAAQNNLISIYNAQKNYYFSTTGNDTYCLTTSTPSCNSTSTANIDTNLSLNITDNNFSYACVTDASGFACTATNNSNGSFKLTITNNSVVLPGGVGCTTGSTASCNPSCLDAANPNYCPSIAN